MKNTWYLVANGSAAVLWGWNPEDRRLRELWRTDHPESRAPRSALQRDRPGRYRQGGHVGSSDLKRRSAEEFVEEAVARAASRMSEGDCRRLFIVAPSPLCASLNRRLTPDTRDRISGVLEKDYTHTGPKELRRLLEKAALLPGGACPPAPSPEVKEYRK